MSDTVSVLTGGTNSFQTTAEHLNYVATDFASDGVVGTFANSLGVAPMTGALAANAQGSPNMTVAITTGSAYVTATPTGQASQRLRAKIAAQNATIAANATGSTRYDWIYVKIDPTNANTPAVAGDNVASIVVSRSTSNTSDTGTPPTYGYNIAVVTVVNGAASISNGSITDKRAQSVLSASTASSGWSTGTTPTTVTANGNNNYSLVFNSTDLTSTLSNGMKLRLTRTATAPTQTTLLNGTTQYYSKSSPSAMTFTDDFTVSAWVKLTSYGTFSDIASRYNGTSGWIFAINTTGQVVLQGLNAGAANYSQVLSSRAIPLNKWVHVAAQLDMSTFTATTTTSYTMIDGVDTVATVSRAGTNPTALIQAGNLNIGSENSGGANFFPGKLSQVAIYNAKVTQATVLASMNQTLTGSESSLISAYSFNNSITDLSANANNLTANASAVATNGDSPFAGGANASTAYTAGTTEFGEVFGVSFSTNTTIVVQVPDGYLIPTSGGVSALAYSTNNAPLGFPPLGSVIGYAQIGADFTSTSVTTFVDISGTSVTVYVPAGRKVEIEGWSPRVITSGVTNISLGIFEGAAQYSEAETQQTAGNVNTQAIAKAIIYPTAGSHTYKLSIYQGAAGTMRFGGTTISPGYISVKLV